MKAALARVDKGASDFWLPGGAWRPLRVDGVQRTDLFFATVRVAENGMACRVMQMVQMGILR